jgi:hypothetical protein
LETFDWPVLSRIGMLFACWKLLQGRYLPVLVVSEHQELIRCRYDIVAAMRVQHHASCLSKNKI